MNDASGVQLQAMEYDREMDWRLPRGLPLPSP